MKIYSLPHGESGPVYYAKKNDALAAARNVANEKFTFVYVCEETITEPISRQLICNMLNGTGLPSESRTVEIVWPTDKAARKADTIMLGARKAAPAQPDGGVA